MRIIIAEDAADCRAILSKAIAQQGDRQVVVAENGADAWWHLSDPTQKFDLAILDVNMPGVDGLKLLGRIRQDSRTGALPVILCTASTDRITVAGAANLGVTSYIVKPVNATTLLQKISSVEATMIAA